VVVVRAEDYLGRKVEDVQAELAALGLSVQLVEVPTEDVKENRVTAVDPTGELAPSSRVTVSYAVKPQKAPPPGRGRGNGNGNGNNGNGNDD
jgi:serine/threonine-protein kinase